MEIVFKLPARPEQKLPHDALVDNRSETSAALLSTNCDTTFTTTFLPSKSLLSPLQALEILETRFRLDLTNIDFKRSFTPKEQFIIQDASDGLYAEDDIEGAFYKHGGYYGIIALILYFRKSQEIQWQWAAITEGLRGRFVKNVAEMLSGQIIEWIPKYLDTKGLLGAHSLQYIGRHAGRKRKRHTSETKGSSGVMQGRSSSSKSATVPQQCQQSQEIHQIGQAVASCNPRRQDLQSFQPHQDTSVPISNVSSPEQNPPQKQQEIASISYQYIPTPRSNVSSHGNNDSPSSVLAPSEGAVDLTRSIETILKAPFQTIPTQSHGENPCLPTPRPREDLFAGPVRDTRSSSFQPASSFL